MKKIGTIHTDFPTKFGVARQSRLEESLKGYVTFEKEYASEQAFRGLEEFSHIWLLWEFSENIDRGWSYMVAPPRLGGRVQKGVFATRSPFRPNPIGLSCVKLDKIEYDKNLGTVLYVSGVDMMDETPLYDIKPYIPYSDCVPEASGGFTEHIPDYELKVDFPEEMLKKLPEEKRAGALAFIKMDPRPAYHNHPEQIYKIGYAGFDIRFRVDDETKTAHVVEVTDFPEDLKPSRGK